MTRRVERVSSQIRRILADAILHRLADPHIVPLTSVTRVTISPDLAVAKVYVSVMAEPQQQHETLRALRRAVGRLRKLLGEELSLRLVPELLFLQDESLQRAAETLALIDRSVAEDQANHPSDASGPTDQVTGGDPPEAEATDTARKEMPA